MRRLLLVGIAAAACCNTPALAVERPVKAPIYNVDDNLEPPAKYLHAYQYELITYEASKEFIKGYCGDNIFACATPAGKLCFVVMPLKNTVEPSFYNLLMRHEIAHCNGWSIDHRN